jgi:hypothetical protein
MYSNPAGPPNRPDGFTHHPITLMESSNNTVRFNSFLHDQIIQDNDAILGTAPHPLHPAALSESKLRTWYFLCCATVAEPDVVAYQYLVSPPFPAKNTRIDWTGEDSDATVPVVPDHL